MRTTTLTILVGAIAAAPAAAQDFAARTATLAAASSFDDDAVGEDGHKSQTFRAYEQWRDHARPADLLAATGHDAPVVRCYAVRALLETGARFDPEQVMRRRVDDTEPVETYRGCIRAERLVGDVVFELLRPRLEPAALSRVVVEMVERDSGLYAREWALCTLRLPDRLLHRVRELARGGDGPAAVALARYQLRSDVPFLVGLVEGWDAFRSTEAMRAAEAFPDPRLLPALVGHEPAARARLQRGLAVRLRFWLRAIAAQRSEAAARFLLRFWDEAGPKQPRALRKAYEGLLQEHGDCAAFAALRMRLR